MTEYRDWSITASANTGNAVDGYFKENMAYSDVNDAAREFQAILARDRLDKNGTLVSTGATSSYIVTINATLSAYQDGDVVAFQAHAKNDGASTLTIRHPGGSLSARPVVKTDLTALDDNDIVAGGTYVAFYKSASANWQIQGVPLIPTKLNQDLSISGTLSVQTLNVAQGLNATGVINTRLNKIKLTDTSTTAATALSTDPHLANFSLSASCLYKVTGSLYYFVQLASTNLNFLWDGADGIVPDDDSVLVYQSVGDDANSRVQDISQTAVVTCQTGSFEFFNVMGHVKTSAEANISFQWAANSHGTGSLIELRKGSWITFEKVADI